MARHVFPGQTVHVHQGHDGFRNRVVHPQVRHRVHEPLVQRAGPHQPRALRGAVLVIRHGLVCCGVAVGLAAVRVLLAPTSAARCARHPGRPAARVAFPRALESLERPALLHAVMVRHHLLVRNRGGGVVYAAPGVRGVPVVGMGIHAARRWVPGVTSTHRRRVRRLLLREVVRHRVLVHLHLRMRMRGGSGGGGVPGVLRRRLLRHRRHRGGGGVCGGRSVGARLVRSVSVLVLEHGKRVGEGRRRVGSHRGFSELVRERVRFQYPRRRERRLSVDDIFFGTRVFGNAVPASLLAGIDPANRFPNPTRRGSVAVHNTNPERVRQERG